MLQVCTKVWITRDFNLRLKVTDAAGVMSAKVWIVEGDVDTSTGVVAPDHAIDAVALARDQATSEHANGGLAALTAPSAYPTPVLDGATRAARSNERVHTESASIGVEDGLRRDVVWEGTLTTKVRVSASNILPGGDMWSLFGAYTIVVVAEDVNGNQGNGSVDFPSLKDQIETVAAAVWQSLVSLFNAARSIVAAAMELIASFVESTIRTIVERVVSPLFDILESVPPQLIDTIEFVVDVLGYVAYVDIIGFLLDSRVQSAFGAAIRLATGANSQSNTFLVLLIIIAIATVQTTRSETEQPSPVEMFAMSPSLRSGASVAAYITPGEWSSQLDILQLLLDVLGAVVLDAFITLLRIVAALGTLVIYAASMAALVVSFGSSAGADRVAKTALAGVVEGVKRTLGPAGYLALYSFPLSLVIPTIGMFAITGSDAGVKRDAASAVLIRGLMMGMMLGSGLAYKFAKHNSSASFSRLQLTATIGAIALQSYVALQFATSISGSSASTGNIGDVSAALADKHPKRTAILATLASIGLTGAAFALIPDAKIPTLSEGLALYGTMVLALLLLVWSLERPQDPENGVWFGWLSFVLLGAGLAFDIVLDGVRDFDTEEEPNTPGSGPDFKLIFALALLDTLFTSIDSLNLYHAVDGLE